MSAIFTAFPLEPGPLAHWHDGPFPTEIGIWGEREVSLPSGGTTFGYVHSGLCELRCAAGTFSLGRGMYFAVPDGASVRGGLGLFIRSLHHDGMMMIGGPVETFGRLRYIDGCTDSLIIPPPILGDPCLNLLHLPPGTHQTAHTHPSFRVGLILSGHGECITPDQRIPLRPGMPFVIAAEGLHCFHTHEEALRVLAYHPDSDYGPTHENHPMINRTIIDPARR